MGKRFFALFAAFTVLFFVSVPAFATGMTPGGVGGGVAGIPVVGEIQLDVVDFSRYCDDKVRGYGNFIWHLIDNDVCSHAPQLGGSHNFVPRRTQVDGQIGTYYVCEYCGRASGEVLEEAYDEYLVTLPSMQVDSSGAFLWCPGAGDCRSDGYTGYLYFWYEGNGARVSLDNGRYSAYGGSCVVSTGQSISLGGNSTSGQFSFYIDYITVPYDGWYKSANSGLGLRTIDGFFAAGSSFSGPALGRTTGGFALISWPLYWVTSLTELSGFAAQSRVSGVADMVDTGLYGYVQDGQLYQSPVGTIYNETTNVYSNPVTGDTSNVTSWTYDYSDRSYTLTTDEGDTVTVTYGDTNVTINDGGTTYNVYYLTEHDESVPEHYYTSSVTLAPTCTGTGVRTYTCDDCGDTYTETIPATGHSNQSAVTMPPTCVNTGVKTFTCSVCGDSYTQSIPATGHTWTVTKTVPNQYDDETGELTQAGYTLYECSTCGEQYRIDAASSGETLPSPSTGGTSIGTGNSGGEALTPDIDSSVGRGFLATIAHGLTEDLPEVLGLISEWFKTVPALYNGYSNFLAASFAWMPPDCVMLLTFSVGMVTVIAICRAMFRR